MIRARKLSHENEFDDCLSADRPVLHRLSRNMRSAPQEQLIRLKKKFDHLLALSRQTFRQRQENLPKPTFPEALPVSSRREEIARLLTDHQVIIVSGETGSGKTTQLPKICLSLGRGAAGLIGHTQPRRLAARATANRIAQELQRPLGETVGYKIRFTDRVSKDSYIKLMTDGILLAETQTDSLLAAYDTLIIDEAHERSLNIDFLLGYLKTLLPRRPDLKLIITSATLDAQRFASHFRDKSDEPAPVIEVSGRLYPIEIRYRPVENPAQSISRKNNQPDLLDTLVDAADEAQRCGPGDILVFLPGEREIREAAEALRKAHHLPGTEILPLYARQSAQEQARIFASGKSHRIVLATNVAETSLTVPGIRYVIDPGLARIKRYSPRNKVELLQIEKIAQSSAQQRAGRCGRVMDGICFRLYDEADFHSRPPHTDPEILRSSLAGVILRMKSLNLGQIEDFPFIDPPGSRLVGDGYQLLVELGAIGDDYQRKLTSIGRELAKLPVDPKIGRMILAARDRGCLKEVLIIAAALSVQDPRDRPQDHQAAADQAHAAFRGKEQDQRSEFLWYLRLWENWTEIQRHESGNQQKQWCRRHFLSWLRLREWRDVHNQLHTVCTEHGWKENQLPAQYEAIHKALLAGLLGHIGCKIEDASGPQAGSYLGARGIKFWPHPGSSLAKKAGKWIMCAELVDTSRLFGRCIARIEPEWIEEVGAHLLRRQVYEPHWSKTAGAVRAWERGTVHGLTLYARRGISYRDIDPAICRTLLIREGLVAGEIAENRVRNMSFLVHNRKLVADIERLEHKSRRPDVLVDETLIEAFYDAKVPQDVLDLTDFERWRKHVEQQQPKYLYLSREQLMRHEAEGITTKRFPAHLKVLGQKLKLGYRHAPGEADDGVTLTVPLTMLNQVPAIRCEWLVPGLLEEKIIALLKTVPPKHRHRLQPIGESASIFMSAFDSGEFDHNEPLVKVLQRFVETRVQLKLPLESFRMENLPPHCFMNFRLIDEHGRMLGQSRNLSALRTEYREQISRHFSQAVVEKPISGHTEEQRNAAEVIPLSEQSGFTDWEFGPLPELIELKIGGREVIGFPALHDDGDSVSLRPYDTPEEAASVHRIGMRRLFALRLKEQVRAVERLPGLRALGLQYVHFGTDTELKCAVVNATLTRACLSEPLPTDALSFAQRCAEAKPRISLIAQELIRLIEHILSENATVQKRLTAIRTHQSAVQDIRSQIDALLPRNFITLFPWERLTHFPRYLKAIALRIDKLRSHPARDAERLQEWHRLWSSWQREIQIKRRAQVIDPFLEDYRWLLEELRVGLFAQELKTPMPVSVKRLQKIWDNRPQ